ncbi:hypothetical protein [Laspinema sp. D2d]|nr:hypothetical protein [Laspinema sp. D2d]
MKFVERRRSPPQFPDSSPGVGKATLTQINLTPQPSQIVAIHRL